MAEIAPSLPARGAPRSVPLAWLGAALLGLFTLDSVLLLRYLAWDAKLVALVAVLACAAVVWLAATLCKGDARVSLRTLRVAFAMALCVLLLGGEGRVFYATPDWQIRDAVLADLARHPWPVAYGIDGTAYILRAPLGMYLLPALAGQGGYLDFALLVSNALHLGLVFALGSALVDRAAARWILLAVFLLFSGWDALGVIIHGAAGLPESWDLIEPWNDGLQFSSTLTVAFWAPNHGIAGWACAVAFQLWRRGIAPISLFAAIIPLVAFWSPLAVMGAVPFAVYAGIIELQRRDFGWRDLALAAAACAVALPVLWFERLDPGAVAMHIKRVLPLGWIGLAVEMIPVVMIAFTSPWFDRKDRTVLWIIVTCLTLMPAWQIGFSVDFQMRASIMPLTLLAIAWAGALSRALDASPRPFSNIAALVAILAVGAVTPALELKRVLVSPASPPPLCSLAGAWRAQSGMIPPYGTYLARQSTLSGDLRNAPVTAGRYDPQHCWASRWVVPDPAN